MKMRYLVLLLAATACSGVTLGAVAHGVVWPWSLGAQFWRDFWAGPPTAGIFALIAAVIAFFPAYRSTRLARDNAAREQWWKRAEWALGLAASTRDAEREIANHALIALNREATQLESDMIYILLTNLQTPLDTRMKKTHNDAKVRRRR